MLKFQSSRRLWTVFGLVLFLLFAVGQVSASSNQHADANVAPPAEEQPLAIVASGALNVRNGPGVGYRSIAVIYQGQSVELLGRWATNNWVLIRLWNGTEGWVNSNYLQTGVPVTDLPVIGGAPPDTPTPVPPIAGPVAIVNTGALNLRSGPGPSFQSVAVVTYGTQLTLLGRNAAATWAEVQIPNGVRGWVNVYYIQSSVPITTLPIVAEPAPDPGPALGMVNTGAVNVRTGPGAQYSSIAVLNGGTTVALIGRNNDATWVKVRLSNGTEGWINDYYLQTNVSVWTLPIVESGPPANGAIVNVGALNVRYGPGTGYSAFTVVYRGQVVAMIGRSAYGTWAQVRIPSGAVGWVNSNLLVSDIDYGSLPVTGP
ncbi:MAG: SH3 domain-containing protein [Chloroflexota bacterium]|jgi:uncharacterized protein YgiM (DUF1202 family)